MMLTAGMTEEKLDQARPFLDLLPDAFLQLDRDFNLIWANQAVHISPDAFGRPCHEVCWQRQEPCFGCAARIALESGQVQTGRLESPYADDVDPSEPISVCDVAAIPVFDNQGATVGVLEVVHNITDSVLREKEFVTYSERTALALEAANNGIWDFDVENNQLYFSPRYYTMLGYKPDEFPASYEAWRDLLHPDDVEASERAVQDHLERRRKDFNIEFRMLAKDGSYRWIVGRGRSMAYGPDGSITRMIGTHTDITEKKQSEQALRQSEDMVRSILRAAPIGIGLVRNRILGWTNRNLQEMTGYTSSELEGRSARMLYPSEEEFLRVGRVKHPQIQKNDFGSIQTQFQRKDGRVIDVWLSSATVVPGDMSAGLVFTASDITESKQAEQALRESESMVRSILRAAPIGIGLIRDRTLGWTNRSLQEMVGYSSSELEGRSTRMLYPSDEEFGRVGYIKYSLLEKHDVGSVQAKFRCKDGRIIDVLISSAAVVPGELSAGVVATVSDITDQKRYERELQEAVDALERQNEELERFTYTVSHDLKSPLITIKGFLGVLREDMSRDARAVEEDIGRIEHATDRMEELLNDLLEISRVGRLTVTPEDVPLTEIAREVVKLLHGPLTRRQGCVTVEDALPVVHGEENRLRALFQNLIENAIKFADDTSAPDVLVGQMERDGQEIIFVRDNGIGIDPSFHQRIFGLFRQLNPAIEGTGIGLTMAAKIVEAHNGKIWVESAGPGHGSTFYFTLPGMA